MSDIVVIGVLASVLTGIAGTSVDATVLAYSAMPQNVTVGAQTVEVYAQVQSIYVPLAVEHGTAVHNVSVQTESLTYTIPVTVVGKKNVGWLWWLLLIPFALIFCAVRLRKAVGSS